MKGFGPETFGALRERWAWWDRSPFTGESTSHVSVYGRA